MALWPLPAAHGAWHMAAKCTMASKSIPDEIALILIDFTYRATGNKN
jgi:hypothetical protein